MQPCDAPIPAASRFAASRIVSSLCSCRLAASLGPDDSKTGRRRTLRTEGRRVRRRTVPSENLAAPGPSKRSDGTACKFLEHEEPLATRAGSVEPVVRRASFEIREDFCDKSSGAFLRRVIAGPRPEGFITEQPPCREPRQELKGQLSFSAPSAPNSPRKVAAGAGSRALSSYRGIYHRTDGAPSAAARCQRQRRHFNKNRRTWGAKRRQNR